MRAWVYHKTGLPSKVLQLEANWPKPTPSGTRQVLVKVHAVSLNPIGFKAMSSLPFSLQQKKPCVSESDLSGVIAGGNLEGTGFAEGDEVFGIIPFDQVMKSGSGSLAEYAIVEARTLTKKPSSLTHEEAASFPLAGLTAWQLLTMQGGLKQGDGKRVFINGGSGGVGAYAIQIAKAHGAYVVSTTSPSSDALTSTLGADELIDYRSVDLPKELKKRFGGPETQFDFVFDTVGVAEVYNAAGSFLKPHGQYLDIAGPHMENSIFSVLSAGLSLVARKFPWRIKYTFAFLEAEKRGPELKEAADLLAKGTIRPVIDQVFPFEEAKAAFERSMSGRAKGKVIITVV